jgi:hypothetical protein
VVHIPETHSQQFACELAGANEDEESQGQEENACHSNLFLIPNWIPLFFAINVVHEDFLDCRSSSNFV